MADAQLAGLPAVLAPDSSISPLILAAITPPLVAGDEQRTLDRRRRRAGAADRGVRHRPGLAVAEQSGAQAQLTGLVGAGLAAVLLLFLNSLLADLPQAALAAVVIAAALSLMDLGVLRRHYEVRRSALGTSLVATAGAVLGRTGRAEGWHDLRLDPDAEQLPGIVIYRWEAPLLFANAGRFREEIRRLARERRPEWIVLQCEAITDVDVTAAELLELLDLELNAAGVHLAFAELRDRLQDLTRRYGLMDAVDRDHFYPTLETVPARFRPGPPPRGRRRPRPGTGSGSGR